MKIIIISESDLKLTDINSIPKEINDYINYRKKTKNTENLFIRSDFIFSREDFITDDYFLCEIILLLTALSKNAEIYMIKICDMNSEIQEFWSDVISKYIEVRTIRGEDESIFQQTATGIFNHLSKDKTSKFSSKKNIDINLSINKSNNTNVVIDFDEQKNLVMNSKKKNFELEKEKNNLLNIIDKKEKEIKELQRIIATLNQQNQEIQKIKDNNSLLFDQKINEYEKEIKKLKIMNDERDNKFKEKKLEEENKNIKEKLIKLVNENLVLKTYKEYKAKYESLLLNQKKEGNNNISSNINIENITETKEKYLIALKNNINIQKENERLRKEIIELKKEKKENSKIYNNKNENGKEIDYKTEFEKVNIKVERYKYLLDDKDKQIERLGNELEKYKNGIINENGGTNINTESKKEQKEINETEELQNNLNNNGNNNNSSRNQQKKINIDNSNNKKIKFNINNNDSKVNLSNKNFSTKNSRVHLKINKNKSKEETNNKTNRKNSKSEKKKETVINNKKNQEPNKSKNNHTVFSSNSNLSYKNNLNINTHSSNDILFNPILNLNSSVKINDNYNFSNILEELKENNINNNKNKLQNVTNTNNNLLNINIKSLLDNIYSKLKSDKKNQNEFFSFLKKIDKELNLNISNQFHENNNSNKNNNKLLLNQDITTEHIKELKKELNQYKRKESDTKLKLTFLQSEKNKLEEEKQKLQLELKRKSLNTPYKETEKNSLIKKYYSSTKKVNGYTNLNINSELSKLTMDIIDNSTNKEKEEEIISYEKNKEKQLLTEKGIKYSFKKKKSINKSPSMDAESALHFGKIFSDEKNSMSIYEDELNDIRNENNNDDYGNCNNLEINNEINELKNKINILISDKNSLEEKIKNLNQSLENAKLKESNLENINTNLIKENIELKQSLLLLKENYDNEYHLISSSLINLTEKYQKLKKELLKEKNNELK